MLSFPGLLDERMSLALAFPFTEASDRETSAGLLLRSSSSAFVITMHRMNQERLHQTLALAGASFKVKLQTYFSQTPPIILLLYLF